MTQYATDPDWWKSCTGYQIYPRSFACSNGDGVGDIPGIIGKLDYLAELGIGFIWLSPVYASPMADNGYDISNYQDIAPEFGTLADMDALIAGARARGIGIVMDLVVNHSSDEHAWFQSALKGRDAEYRDFYVWRDARDGVPNDLQSYFGGSAWALDEASGQYYLHLFDRKQPDLNWANPALRQAVYAMMNCWLDRGIAGFRMDVIDLIGKEPDRGIIADGPNLHPYIREMHEATLKGRNVVTVGEAWSATPAGALLYSGQDAGELSMVFQFEHVSQQHDPVLGKFKPKPFDLVALKRVFNRWQAAMADDGWNSLFWGNHDLPYLFAQDGHLTCPGFSWEKQGVIEKALAGASRERFRLAHNEDGWLFSHAGFAPQHVEGASPDLLAARANGLISKLSADRYEPLLACGVGRGGRELVGGITWLDWWCEFTPTAGLNQIVGHTPGVMAKAQLLRNGDDQPSFVNATSPRVHRYQSGNKSTYVSVNWCLDCRLNQVALVHSQRIEIVDTGSFAGATNFSLI